MAQPPRIGEEVPPDLLEIGAEVPESMLEPETAPGPGRPFGSQGVDLAIGAAKGLGSTVTNLGELALQAPGLGPMLQALNQALFGLRPEQQQASFGQAREALAPSNGWQTVGRGAEQIGEFLVPAGKAELAATTLARAVPRARGALRIGAQAGAGAGVTRAQGGSPTAGAVAGAVGGALAPLATKGVGAAATWLERTAAPGLVRSGLKPTVTAMKQQAGASWTGIDAQARRLADFILKERITTPDKAEAIIKAAEAEIQQALKGTPGLVRAGTPANNLTDAPVRGLRYLQALKRSAEKQGLPEHDVRIIVGKAREFLRGVHGETVTITPPGGLPRDVRIPRQDMTAPEALESARATSKWQTRKAYGEQKGAAVEAAKAVERADRDAVKTAVPATRAPFQRQSQAIRAKGALDRQAFREANRDPVSLPAQTLAAGGRNVLALASNWLRNNSVRAGIYAQDLARAIKRQDVAAVSAILTRLGVPVASLATQP